MAHVLKEAAVIDDKMLLEGITAEIEMSEADAARGHGENINLVEIAPSGQC